jgi:hypothetical protein
MVIAARSKIYKVKKRLNPVVFPFAKIIARFTFNLSLGKFHFIKVVAFGGLGEDGVRWAGVGAIVLSENRHAHLTRNIRVQKLPNSNLFTLP